MTISNSQPGDVWWVNFSDRNPQGNEMEGRHPAIVLSNPQNYGRCRFDTLIVIPTTSQVDKFQESFPLYIRMPNGDCFSKDCIAMLDQIQAVCVSRISDYMGSLNIMQLAALKAAAKEILTLS